MALTTAERATIERAIKDMALIQVASGSVDADKSCPAYDIASIVAENLRALLALAAQEDFKALLEQYEKSYRKGLP